MPFTSDPAAKLGAIAAALATAFGAIDGLTVLDYDPIGAAISSPTLAIGDVEGGSTDVMQADHELGFRDWPERWSIALYVFLDAPDVAYALARSLIGEAIAALDMDPTLGGEVREASLTSFRIEPNEPDSVRRMLIGYLTVSLIHFQPNEQ